MPFMNNNFPIYSAIRRTIFLYGKNSDETFFLINDRSFACEKLRKGTRRIVTQRYLIAPSIVLRNAGKVLFFWYNYIYQKFRSTFVLCSFLRIDRIENIFAMLILDASRFSKCVFNLFDAFQMFILSIKKQI